MRIESECFLLPKAGNRSDEYEDASIAAYMFIRRLTYYRFAIADGASESSFAEHVGGFARKRLLQWQIGGMQIHKSSLQIIESLEEKTKCQKTFPGMRKRS